MFVYVINKNILIYLVNEKTQQILPWAASALCLGYAMYVTFILFRKKGKVNKAIEKDSNKVVHTLDIEDIGKKTVLCRCWRSEKVYFIFSFSTMV